MPIVIQEVLVEVVEGPTQPDESHSLPASAVTTVAEQSVLDALALIQQRRERLEVD